MINNLSDYKVEINIGEGKGIDYVGYLNPLNTKWIGKEQVIKEPNSWLPWNYQGAMSSSLPMVA